MHRVLVLASRAAWLVALVSIGCGAPREEVVAPPVHTTPPPVASAPPEVIDAGEPPVEDASATVDAEPPFTGWGDAGKKTRLGPPIRCGKLMCSEEQYCLEYSGCGGPRKPDGTAGSCISGTMCSEWLGGSRSMACRTPGRDRHVKCSVAIP